MDLSPEFRLAAACCIWPPSEARARSVRDLAAVADWPALIRVVQRHRIGGLVHAGLTDAHVKMPGEIAKQLSTGAAHIALQNLAMAVESIRVHTLFEGANISTTSFKGVSLAQLAYGSISLKHGKDIDLLVDVGDMNAALTLLEHDGYRPFAPATVLIPAYRSRTLELGQTIALIDKGNKIQIELHSKLVRNPALLRGVGTSSPKQQVALSKGHSVSTLCDEDLFAYLSVHGATHRWARLKWLADFAAFCSGKSGDDLARCYRAAEAKGAGVCARQGLLLAKEVLGFALPAVLERESSGSGSINLIKIAIEAMMSSEDDIEPDGTLLSSIKHSLRFQRLGKGWRFHLSEIALTFGPNTTDRIVFPLPALLRFLYLPLRLPLRLIRRTIMARNR